MPDNSFNQEALNKLMRDGWSWRDISGELEKIEDDAALVLADRVEYFAENDILTLSLELPDEIAPGFRSALDFGCGSVPTALVYSDSIIWSGDSLDDNGKFVPIHDHRYHVDVWYDGVYIRANASGVIIR